jgi:hypothetical protein
MPLPFLVDRADDASENWRIGTASPCTYGCDRIIAEIAARHLPLYDLNDPLSTPIS